MSKVISTAAFLALFISLSSGLESCGCPPPPDEETQPDTGGLIAFDAGPNDSATADLGISPDGAVGSDRRVGVADPDDPNNHNRDSDCDGLSDAEEFGNIYAGGDQTSADDPDSDGDGLLDGVELGRTETVDERCGPFAGDADPGTQTDPTDPDTDGDGLLDGAEDDDHDGAFQPGGELNPRDPDTDDDGLCDGPDDVPPICTGGDPNPFAAVSDVDQDGLPDEVDAAPDDPDRDGDGLCDGPRDVAGTCVGGEDLNGDGVMGASETDPDRVDTDCDGLTDGEEQALGLNPRKRDSDGDLIPDGIEAGVAQNPDPSGCPDFAADADPGSTTDALAIDSDGDGINDGVEDADRDGQVDAGETDPTDPDSDGDGICDGPPTTIAAVCSGGEDLNANGVVDQGETDPRVAGTTAADRDADGIPDTVEEGVACLNPNVPDSDGDGLCDGPLSVAGTCAGGEDGNANGRVDLGETDPCDVDSDCDGLVDGPSYGSYLGEQTMGTSPTSADTDGDGLADGLESSVAGAANPPGTTSACGYSPDADPTTGTDPTAADSDSDGVPDGAEDADQNGRVDDGELDPNDGGDATGPVIQACGTAGLVPVDQLRDWVSDLQMATAVRSADAFTEQVLIEDTSGASATTVGLMGFNPHTAVAFLALTRSPVGASAADEEAEARALLTQAGALAAPITTQLSTWDGYPAVRASYDQAGTRGVKAQANGIVQRFIPSTGALLSAAGDVSPVGGYKLKAEYVRRSDNTAVVLIALVPADRSSGQSAFSLDDTANGTALAQFGDTVGVQCDRFDSQGYADVDFVWAVDNSGSMRDDQAAVAAMGQEMGNVLNSSAMDWRQALVTSEYDQDPAAACLDLSSSPCRLFTTDIPTFTDWFTAGAASWVTDTGSASENTMYSSMLIIRDRFSPSSDLLPAPNDKLRRGAYLVVIFLTDAEDQRDGWNTEIGRQANIAEYTSFFEDFDPTLPGDQAAILGGFLCAPGEDGSGGVECDPQFPSLTFPVVHGVINNMGGVIGDLLDASTIRPTLLQILSDVAGATSPYSLSKPPISSTIKVALEPNTTVGACTWNDVPRDRQHGFDYDPVSGTIVFYGDCRPAPDRAGSQVVVSYRYWADRTPDPDGPGEGCDCAPPEVCDPLTLECYCPPDCGQASVPPERVCDTATCTLICRPDCGAGCPGNSVCDPAPAVCACECPTDCGGAAPADNYVCDRDPASPTFCTYLCDQCPGSPVHPSMTCDPLSCSWTCPDCGDCQGLATCSDVTCACECAQTLSCDTGYTWDQPACDCVCDAQSLGCTERYQADSTLCACVCRDNCGDTCEEGMVCNESLCACVPRGG